MNDLVSRLRERHSFLCDEAAEEIARLRELLRDIGGFSTHYVKPEWRNKWAQNLDLIDAALAGAAVQPIAVTGNCGLCGQPRADHAEVAPDGKPECRMKENSHHG